MLPVLGRNDVIFIVATHLIVSGQFHLDPAAIRERSGSDPTRSDSIRGWPGGRHVGGICICFAMHNMQESVICNKEYLLTCLTQPCPQGAGRIQSFRSFHRAGFMHAMVQWCNGMLKQWSDYAMVSWWIGTSGIHGATVQWCIRAIVQWCKGVMV